MPPDTRHLAFGDLLCCSSLVSSMTSIRRNLMRSRISRRYVLAAGVSALALGALPPRHAQSKDQVAFQLRVHRTGFARRCVQVVCHRHQGRLRLRALLGQHAVQAGHGAHRPAAGQPRNGQSRARGHIEADSRVVADDLGLPVSRRRPPEEDVQERRRARVHQDGPRPARHPDHHARLLRIAQRQPEARPPDQDAGGHGGNQTADAAR